MSAVVGVDETFCDANQQSLSNNASFTILTSGQSIGLALTAEASLLSFGATLVIFVMIARNLLHYKKTLPNSDWKLLVRTPTEIYMLFLFGFEIVQAIGGALNIRWAHDGIVTTGPYCTVQGTIKQIGQLGVAMMTLMLTVHTFTTALWGVGAEARNFAFGIVGLACLYIVLWVGITNGIHKDFETPTPYWCWISSQYKRERLTGHLSVDDKTWYKFRLKKSHVALSQRRAIWGILFYPLAYSLVMIPDSVFRWLLFSHKSMPSAATFFGIIMFNLSGAINVLLFLIVRPHLLLFTPPEELVEPEVELANPNPALLYSPSVYVQP